MTSSAASMPPADPATMVRLWQRMVAIYGHRWVSSFGVSAENGEGYLTLAAETWARGLAGVTNQQIGQGVAACVTGSDSWPPTLPAFRALCLGIPTYGAIRAELLGDTADRTPFARFVWTFVDSYAYRMSPGSAADRMLREAYETARDAVMRGAKLPEPSPAIAAPEPEPMTRATDETAQREIDALKSYLAQEPPK